MTISSRTRFGCCAASLVLGGCTFVAGQSLLPKPSAAVSALPAAEPTGQVQRAASAPGEVAQRVEVKYADGKLAVTATNASLSEILHEVAQKTGIKVTGGVADDRVFGVYGPSKPSVVLDALLEGSGSNMLLVDDAQGRSELILTPRRGGVTPPNPNASQSNQLEDSGPVGTYVPPVRPYQAPQATGRGPVGAVPDPLQPVDSEPADNNGPKTPQQIYEQLQRTMQQKQSNAPPQ